jgi:hypothetical protein
VDHTPGHSATDTLGSHARAADPREVADLRADGYGSFSNTATWLWLPEVNGARSQPAHRSRTRKPVIMAIKSSSDGRPCRVRARAAEGQERSRLWAWWREIAKNLDAYASLRSSETAVVILEPRSTPVQ